MKRTTMSCLILACSMFVIHAMAPPDRSPPQHQCAIAIKDQPLDVFVLTATDTDKVIEFQFNTAITKIRGAGPTAIAQDYASPPGTVNHVLTQYTHSDGAIMIINSSGTEPPAIYSTSYGHLDHAKLCGTRFGAPFTASMALDAHGVKAIPVGTFSC